MLLTTPDEWTAAEHLYPVSLVKIVEHLELPLRAGISWERLNRSSLSTDHIAEITFHPSLWNEIARRVKGTGGAQHTYQRMLDRRRGNRTVLSRNDFSLIRERAAVLRGGWGSTFKKLAIALEPMIRAVGSVEALFLKRAA